MKIDIHHHLHIAGNTDRAVLDAIANLKETIMATQAELASQLNTVSTKVQKVPDAVTPVEPTPEPNGEQPV